MANFPTALEPSKEEKLHRFWSLGYFQGKGWDEVKTFVLQDKIVKQAVEKYRDFHGLPPGDQIDSIVTEDLSQPRCGVPDFVRPMEAGVCKWSFTKVSFAHRLEALNPLDAALERMACQEALAAWNAVCGIELYLIDDMKKANIYAETGATGSGVLAYSYMPCGNTSANTRLQQVYNKATQWFYNLLLNVIIHEIGHAIGLDHGPSGCIMQPTANGSITRPQSWDITQGRNRYGQPKPQPPTPQPPGPTPDGPSLVLPNNLVAGRYRLVLANDWDVSPKD